jgi:hypothetical protein
VAYSPGEVAALLRCVDTGLTSVEALAGSAFARSRRLRLRGAAGGGVSGAARRDRSATQHSSGLVVDLELVAWLHFAPSDNAGIS